MTNFTFMKYVINTYDPQRDIANVTFTYKYKTVQQPPLTVNAHNVPVQSKPLMDAWSQGWIQAVKRSLREADNRALVVVDPVIVGEQTVTDPPEE